MNTPHNLLVAAAFAAIAGNSALAQDPVSTSPHLLGGARDVSAASCGLAPHDGAIVGVGRGYKARFDRIGVAFTPALGERAAHNMPLHLGLQSIRRGQAVLHDGTDVDARIVGQAVVYDHGKIHERYDVHTDAIEQSFVFDERPAGDGDLVVRCALTTELQPQTNADGTLSFLLPEVGGVHIGKVTGIAADGERCEGRLRLDGDVLELSLPDAFVDRAAFPLVLDPRIGGEFTVYDAIDGYDSDQAYDSTSNRYVVVFNRRYSFTDIDVYAQRINAATGALVGGTIIVDATISTLRRPRIATVHASDRCLAVWQISGSPLGPWNVRGAAVSPIDGTVSALVDIAATAADEFNPVVGGDATTSDNEAIVVWETDTGIQASQVTVPAAGNPTVIAPISLSTSALDNTPAISKASGTSLRHVIAWQRSILLNDSEIVAQAVNRNLGLLGGLLTVTTNSVTDARPTVDGDGTTFMVAWERNEAGGSTNKDIVCATLIASNSGLTINTAATAIEATQGQDEYGPDIAILGSRFCVTYAERASALFDDCFAWLVNPNCTVCNAKLLLDGLNGPGWNRESAPRIASAFPFNVADDTALITFSEALDRPPFTSRVIGQRIENQSNGSGAVLVGSACGTGGAIGINSPFVPGNTAFAFTLSGADPNALLFLSLGFPGSLFPPCGSCQLMQPITFDFKQNFAGTASSPYPTSCDPIYLGLTLEAQWVSFNTAVSPCASLPSVSTSRRMQITLVE
ncbi:MAG: hypothetical protein IPK26_01040 [Planctomycetes bacterium]|nr:hypothetical protein [Planctomycetota bacterium]